MNATRCSFATVSLGTPSVDLAVLVTVCSIRSLSLQQTDGHCRADQNSSPALRTLLQNVRIGRTELELVHEPTGHRIGPPAEVSASRCQLSVNFTTKLRQDVESRCWDGTTLRTLRPEALRNLGIRRR